MDPTKIRRFFRKRGERALTGVRTTIGRAMGKPIVHFLHVGKTGGSAVKNALRPYVGRGTYSVMLHPHKFALRDVRQGEKAIFFLRHPFARFVSGFYSLQSRGRPLYDLRWLPEEELAFSRFRSANDLARALSDSDETVRTYAAEAMRSIRHLRDSFYTWFESDEYFLSRRPDVLFCGFQERMEQDFASLLDILGLSGKTTLPSDSIAANKTSSGSSSGLDRIARENLSRWYARDIHFFSLCAKMFDFPGHEI